MSSDEALLIRNTAGITSVSPTLILTLRTQGEVDKDLTLRAEFLELSTNAFFTSIIHLEQSEYSAI